MSQKRIGKFKPEASLFPVLSCQKGLAVVQQPLAPTAQPANPRHVRTKIDLVTQMGRGKEICELAKFSANDGTVLRSSEALRSLPY